MEWMFVGIDFIYTDKFADKNISSNHMKVKAWTHFLLHILTHLHKEFLHTKYVSLFLANNYCYTSFTES